MNNITIFRDSLHGYAYYRFKGREIKLKINENVFKIDEPDFDGEIISKIPEFTFYSIPTTDGIPTFGYISSGPSRTGGGGRRGVTILDNGTIKGFAQNINFTGSGVSVTFTNGQANVNIPGSTATIGGGGTLNRIPKFTPDGSTIGDSLLFDNGTSVLFGGTTAIPSAGIAITSTTQGFLTPRMTTVQRNAIVAPATGLLVYNTSTSLFSYWDGVTWQNIDSQAGGDVSGSGTTNFITKWTDGPNSVIGDSQVFDDGTSVGIGIALPLSKLHVAGAIRTGVASTTNGSLVFQNSTNVNTLTINSGVTSASHSWTLPLAQGAASTVLTNNGAGVLSWASPSATAWMLDGNTVGAEKWIGTIDNFNFPIRTNNTVRGLVDNGGLWAIGSSSTTAGSRLTITATGTGNTTYGLRIYNSTPTERFSVRDDGYFYGGVNSSITFGAGRLFDNTVPANTFFGTAASAVAPTGAGENSGFGSQALGLLTTGIRNAAFGTNALRVNTTADRNSAFGAYTLYDNTGEANSAFGFGALFSNTVGTQNTSVGASSLQLLVGNFSNNTAMGWQSMNQLVGGANNVAYGAFSGKYELGSDAFYINNQDRSNTANDKAYSLLYGKFSVTNNVTTSDQFIRVNGNLGILTNTFGTSADGVLGIFNATTVPSTSPADMIQIFSVDISAGNASLGLRTETAVVTETVVSDRTLSVTINGTVYKICLKV